MVDRIGKWKSLSEGGRLNHLWEAAKFMCAPFWWHNNDRDRPAFLHNGTICVIDTGDRVIGVTAGHVFRQLEEDRASGATLVCQLGADTLSPFSRVIDIDDMVDLATFDLPEWKERSTTYRTSRAEWPHPRASQSDWVLYGGFPGSLRALGQVEARFVFETITGHVGDVTPTRIILHGNSSHIISSTTGRPDHLDSSPAGMSGGPVLVVDDSTAEPTLALVGFITEAGSFDTLLAQHADLIQPDGTIRR